MKVISPTEIVNNLTVADSDLIAIIIVNSIVFTFFAIVRMLWGFTQNDNGNFNSPYEGGSNTSRAQKKR